MTEQLANFEASRADLWKRWQSWIDRMRELQEQPIQGAQFYSEVPLFDLRRFSARRFRPGGRLHREPQEKWRYRSEYWLDDSGRPLRMRAYDSTFRAEGFYGYSPDRVEYVEYSIASRLPRIYTTVLLEGNCVTSVGQIFLNCGGERPNWMELDVEDRATLYRETLLEHAITIERFDWEGGTIRSGEGYFEGLGILPRAYNLVYSYSDEGKLLTTVRVWESGEKETVFAATSSRNLQELSDCLAEAIAKMTLAEIAKLDSGPALRAVELCFRAGDDYCPILVPSFEGDGVDGFCLSGDVDQSRWVEFPDGAFDPDLAEFHGRISRAERWGIAAKMLRGAARRINERVATARPVADGFIAFAIDWSMESDRATKIFAECGAGRARIREWKRMDWL